MATTIHRSRGKWLLLVGLALCSLVFTGCEKGTLGVKSSTITGYVLDRTKNTPVADVMVKAESAANHTIHTAMTGGDGSYAFSNLETFGNSGPENWQISVTKFGYLPYYGENAQGFLSTYVGLGDSVIAPVIQMSKTEQLVKGTLRGYPIDKITGAPLSNFKVTVKNPLTTPRYKVFETAEDFRESGFAALDGGTATVVITAENYTDWTSTEVGQAPQPGKPLVVISGVPNDLGVVPVDPVTVGITGTLRNLPGYVLGDASTLQNTLVWAEAAGKQVASGAAQGALSGTIIYTIPAVPVSCGAVSVKCKLRGYDVVVINPSVTISKQRPGGTITAIDADFANIEPIKRDVRVVVYSTRNQEGEPGSFKPGDRARVYIQEGGRDIVPYVDVTSVNYRAEAYFTGVVCGYELSVLVSNLSSGFFQGKLEKQRIPEDGGTTYTMMVQISQ